MRHCFESAYAKINLTLDVLARRPDGYHDLRMIMQTVSLRDNLAIRAGCGGGAIKTVSNLGYLPEDDRNITVKACLLYTSTSATETKMAIRHTSREVDFIVGCSFLS